MSSRAALQSSTARSVLPSCRWSARRVHRAASSPVEIWVALLVAQMISYSL